MKNLINKINETIIKCYGEFDINDLNDIIIELIKDNEYTSKDSIQNLIYELEKML